MEIGEIHIDTYLSIFDKTISIDPFADLKTIIFDFIKCSYLYNQKKRLHLHPQSEKRRSF
jgi:hypothetical protein